MSRPTVVAVLLLLAGVAAAGMTFEEAVEGFDQAISDRIADIQGGPSPAKEELKEAAGLAKALTALRKWGGGTDPKSLKPISSALGAVGKASGDPIVDVWAIAVVQEIAGLAAEAETRAKEAHDAVEGEAGRAKVQKTIGKAEAILDSLAEASDRGKEAAILAKVIATFDKAVAAAEKIRVKEAMARAGVRFSWSGGTFDAPGKGSFAERPGAGQILTAHGASPGDPQFLLNLRIDGLDGTGPYPLGLVEILRQYDASWNTQDAWSVTSGQAEFDLLTDRWASGTFTLTAHSATTGDITVLDGEFSVPLK